MSKSGGENKKFVSKFTKGYRWEPKKIVYEATDEDLTAAGGIGNIVDLFVETPHFEVFRAALPVRRSNASYDTAQFGLTVLSSFWFQHECIEDMEEFDGDPGVDTKMDGVPSTRAVGDWLRDFSEYNIDALNSFLTVQGLSLRKKIAPNNPFVLDMDSTSHVQSGLKMEGLAFNYKDEWCLDSLVAFDDLGFGYNQVLRPGNTFSAVGAPAMIHQVFGAVNADDHFQKQEHYFRADSAFCNEEVIRACLLEKTKFTITAHGNTNWEKEAKNIPADGWKDWEYSKEAIDLAAKKNKPLAKTEVATILYTPTWAENLRFPIVVKRTWKEHDEEGLFHGQGYWQYYGVMTNLSLHKWIPQSVLEHHQGRSNSENFIREAKYGYDLKHFPCKKLRANQAYGLLSLVAHNFYRAMALVDNPEKPHFSKRLRRKLVFIPAKLVNHARTLTMRIPTRFMKEVIRFQQAWKAPPHIPSLMRLRISSTLVFVP